VENDRFRVSLDVQPPTSEGSRSNLKLSDFTVDGSSIIHCPGPGGRWLQSRTSSRASSSALKKRCRHTMPSARPKPISQKPSLRSPVSSLRSLLHNKQRTHLRQSRCKRDTGYPWGYPLRHQPSPRDITNTWAVFAIATERPSILLKRREVIFARRGPESLPRVKWLIVCRCLVFRLEGKGSEALAHWG
jgi:hypothetical protein